MTIPTPTVLLSEADVAERVAALAARIAPHVDDETVAVCLLTGGLWFCADLTRALSRLGVNVAFDALWLAIEQKRIDGRALWHVLLTRLPSPYDAPALFNGSNCLLLRRITAKRWLPIISLSFQI